MKPIFPWVPDGTEVLPDIKVSQVLSEGKGHQTFAVKGMRHVLWLIRRNAFWMREEGICTQQISELLSDGVLSEVVLKSEAYFAGVFELYDRPMYVRDLPADPNFGSGNDLIDLAMALVSMEERFPDAHWPTSIYLRSIARCVCTVFQTENFDKRRFAIWLLTRGVDDPNLSMSQILALNRWLSRGQIIEFFSLLGLDIPEQQAGMQIRKSIDPESFRIHGRPEIEKAFRDYILDYIAHTESYRRMGVHLPNGVLLSGPPGSGKTYAIKKLVEFIGWPFFNIGVSDIGSPYIHETSIRLKELFENAASRSPSIIILEEIDTLAGDRDYTRQAYKHEEVAELLRRIETATENGILVIATSNRSYAIDHALQRKGRFDMVLEIGYPTRFETADLIKFLLSTRPVMEGVNIQHAAERLAGKPISDIVWVVNEAARMTVRNRKDRIDDFSLMESLKKL